MRNSGGRILLVASLSLILAGAGGMAAHAVSGSVSAVAYAQQSSNWCWAAASKTVITYFTGQTPSQCSIVERGKGTTSCPDTTGTITTDVWYALSRSGVADPGVVTARAISFAEIERDIDEKRPIMARWGWNGSGRTTGHLLVITGYNDTASSGQTVSYVNPDGGVATVSADAAFRSDSLHTWDYTRYRINANG